MSRPTDVERGARIAEETAIFNLHPDLFGMQPDIDQLWFGVLNASREQLHECRAMRAALAA